MCPYICQIGELSNLFLTSTPRGKKRGEWGSLQPWSPQKEVGLAAGNEEFSFWQVSVFGSPEPGDFSKLELDSSRGNFFCDDSNFGVVWLLGDLCDLCWGGHMTMSKRLKWVNKDLKLWNELKLFSRKVESTSGLSGCVWESSLI